VLQCAAVCCSVLQCIANTSLLLAPFRASDSPDIDHMSCAIHDTSQCVAVCCSVLQCVAVCCSVLQCVANTSPLPASFRASDSPDI